VFTTLPTWDEKYKKVHQIKEITRRDVGNTSAENIGPVWFELMKNNLCK